MKRLIILAAIGVLGGTLHAGGHAKAPVLDSKAPVVVDKTPIEECVDIGGQITAGYETDYVFRGYKVAHDSVWGDINYQLELGGFTFNVGAWYLNSINPSPPNATPAQGGSSNGLGNNYDELNLYASTGVNILGVLDAEVGYVRYIFPETGAGQTGEIFASFEANLFDIITPQVLIAYDHVLDGWYYQAGIEKQIQVLDNIGIVLGAGVAYSDNYFTGVLPAFGQDSGWNHYYLTASLPIELNCRATLTPYVGYNGAPDTWVVDGAFGPSGQQTDFIHGGISLTVNF
ncbi:MAG: hypothetical protein AAF236_03210 [Verrucomicrobiota bacterium]